MALRKIFIHKRSMSSGFTLLEVLIVIGLMTILASFAMVVDMGNLFGNSFRGEERSLVTLLQTARADAMDNVGQVPHGVAIFPSDHPRAYVLFSGNAYGADPSSYRVIESNYKVAISGAPDAVLFAQLTGNSDFDGTMTLSDPNRAITAAITLNHEGAISW
jgi:prepilin-type N-terminal cleavage/methylation domain-containing protein